MCMCVVCIFVCVNVSECLRVCVCTCVCVYVKSGCIDKYSARDVFTYFTNYFTIIHLIYMPKLKCSAICDV